MDEKEKRRPGGTEGPAVSRERPRDPRRQPKGARPRSGNAAEQARARRARMAAAGQTAEVRAGEKAVHLVEPQAEEPRKKARGAGKDADRRTRSAAARQAPENEEPRAEGAPVRSRSAAQKKKKKKKPHRIYNTNFGFKFLTMLAVVGVIVLAMMIFFRVKHIEVVLKGVPAETEAAADPSGDGTAFSVQTVDGSPLSYYTAEEIITASGINIDDNLLSLSKAAVASRIHAALPYVNEIQIKKKLPSTVIITVSEFTVTYGIQDETGGWWLINREGRVLEQTDLQTVKSHTVVAGMPIQVPQPGDYVKPIATAGADLSEIAAKRTATVTTLPELEKMPYAKQIVSVDVSTSYDVRLWYGTQFEIRLGSTENLTYKLQYLQAVLDQLGKEKTGTIDLTFSEDGDAHFLPFG